jgi:hypothetical protein
MTGPSKCHIFRQIAARFDPEYCRVAITDNAAFVAFLQQTQLFVLSKRPMGEMTKINFWSSKLNARNSKKA